MTTTELMRFDEVQLSQIDEVVSECGAIRAAQEKGIMAAFRMAAGIAKLKEMITEDMLDSIMPLQGTSLGFRTDKDNDRDKDGTTGYPRMTVKECALEALLRGARLVGNEFNIIAGRAYLTKEYFLRALSEFPGLTDLVIQYGVPAMSGGNALVAASGSWVLNGQRMRLVCDISHDAEGRVVLDSRIPIRVNNNMIVDAIMGKADRKFRSRIMERITGTTFSDGEVGDVIEVVPSSTSGASTDGLKGRLASNLSSTSGPAQLEAFYGRKPNEEAKAYHQRVQALISAAKSAEVLAAIQVALDDLKESEFLTQIRYKDLTAKVEARAKEIS